MPSSASAVLRRLKNCAEGSSGHSSRRSPRPRQSASGLRDTYSAHSPQGYGPYMPLLVANADQSVARRDDSRRVPAVGWLPLTHMGGPRFTIFASALLQE